MRKLTKKISMLMVLAMLVGLFSGVVSASAASAWSFKSGKYDVAVGGEINMKKNEYADFDLLKDGKAPTGYTVEWASSDEDVVWVNAKTGQLRADKAKKAEDGDKAVISATFTNTATKKNATRSFTIVVGEAKAPAYTVECADVTAVLGDAIKFAPVVKNAAGKVVKFAEHKSYNGYFLDGKAITNPWTPEEAGEYTVTVAQFAAKADVADIAKAVRKIDVKVTVKTDLAAEATGLKEITVYGDFAKDASFTVKKDSNVKVSVTATIAENGKSAKLATANRLTKGIYTITCGSQSISIDVEDERADKIIVVEKDGEVYTNADRNAAIVHYDVLNQYGESVRKNYSVSWTVSTGTTPIDDRKAGILTIPVAGEGTFVYGSVLVVNGSITSSGYPAFETATMTIGLQNNINTVEVMGVTLGNTGKLLDKAPVSFLGGVDQYYLVFKLLDVKGYEMDFNAASAKTDLTFTSFDPLLISTFDNTTIESKFIDGVEYGAIKLTAGMQLKKGGVAKIRISSNKTGQATNYELKVEADQVLKEFRILPAEDLIIKNNKDNGNTEVTLKYEAIDTNGELITDFRALYGAVTFSHPDVQLTEQNDGSAKLTYTVNKTGQNPVNPSKDYDFPVVITSIVPEGKGSNITLYVKEARYANAVAAYNGADALLEGDKLQIDFTTNGWQSGYVTVYDQYDELINNDELFVGNAINKKATNVAVKVQGGDGNLVVTGSSIVVDGYTIFAPNATMTLQALDGATDDIKAYVVEFALADNTGKLISGSSKNHTFYVADISQAVSFNVSANDGLIKNAENTSTLSVKATLVNGKTVNVPDSAANYKVLYATEAYVYTDASSAALAKVTVGGKEIAPEFIEDKLTEITNGTASQFENQAVINPDGTYGIRKVVVSATATISVGSVSGDAYANYQVKDVVKTTVEVGAYERHITEFGVVGWKFAKAPTDAFISANNGVITYGNFMDYIDCTWDNYSDKNTLGGKADTIVTITGVAENADGLIYNSFKIDANACTTAAPMISGAEIGDKFVVTYEKDQAKLVVNFTVGADSDAHINTAKAECEWY